MEILLTCYLCLLRDLFCDYFELVPLLVSGCQASAFISENYIIIIIVIIIIIITVCNAVCLCKIVLVPHVY